MVYKLTRLETLHFKNDLTIDMGLTGFPKLNLPSGPVKESYNTYTG